MNCTGFHGLYSTVSIQQFFLSLGEDGNPQESQLLLPLDPLERTAGHVDDASRGACHHTDQALPDALEEASCTFLFGTF